MDWRERRYYLIRLNDSNLCWWHRGHDDYGEIYKSYCKMLKKTIPSIKMNSPYNHFKFNDDRYGYDGNKKGIGYVQFMVSCRKKHCELFEKTMLEIKQNDQQHVFIKEITKEMCGQ